ncbi:hypothetical protein Tco_1102526 [Tanacetum coccineum]
MELFTNDDLWFGISDHDAVRVCLLLVATIVFMGRETRYNIPDNVLELVDDLQRKNERDSKKDKDKSVEPPKKKIKVGKVSKKKNKSVEASPEKMTRYNLSRFVWAVKEDLICGFGDNDSNIQPTDYDEPQNSNNVAKESALCEFDAIRTDDYDEADNSYIVDKEDVLELASEKHQFTDEGSAYIYEESQDIYSVSQLLQLASNEKSGTAFDCTQLETNLDETVVDCATVQATLPPNAIEEHEYHPIDKVEVQELHPPPKPASLIYNFETCVGSDDMLGPVGEDQINFHTRDQNPHPTNMVEYLEPHPTPKHASLIDNVKGKKIVSLQLNCVNMELPRSSVKIFTRLKRVSKKGKFRQAPYTPLPATTPITKKKQSKRCNMNFIPMASLDDDDCPIIPLKYWVKALTTHIFPWSITGHNVDRDFWLTLLGCRNEGWLSDKHLDIWCDLMWKFRQPGADWAIAGPYLCAYVMRADVPFWPANGIKYPVL